MALPVIGVDGTTLNDYRTTKNGIGPVGGGGLVADDLGIHQGNMAGLLVGKYRRGKTVFAAQLIPQIFLGHLSPAMDLRVF